MSNREIELHDSEIATIFYFDGSTVIIFSHAYVHVSEGEPGRDAGSGWYQRAELVIGEAPEFEMDCIWPCEVHDGSLLLGDVEHSNMLPIPLEHGGSAKLRLEVSDDDDAYKVIEIEGKWVKLTMLGEPYYVEEFPGSGRARRGAT